MNHLQQSHNCTKQDEKYVTSLGKNRRAICMLLTLCLVLATASQLMANMGFFTIVQQVCKSYRVPVALDQMTLNGEATGKADFHLVLQSRRNNFEEVLLVGYIASGRAIARSGVPVTTIMITVTIQWADNITLVTSASVDLVEKLLLGKIKALEFLRELRWN